jgi:hypothetical protein
MVLNLSELCRKRLKVVEKLVRHEESWTKVESMNHAVYLRSEYTACHTLAFCRALVD